MEIKLTPLHCIFFIYNSFATGTNGILSESEKDRITRCMTRWVGKKNSTEPGKEALVIMRETIAWQNKNILNNPKNEGKLGDVILGTMLSMLENLKNQEWFHRANKEFFLMDIRNIAWADDNFTESEKKWHDMFAELLGINIRISNMSQKEVQDQVAETRTSKIGFRTKRD